MPTKTQAKTTIDGAVVDIKSDIDNILPVGVNVKTGYVSFSPTMYTIVIDAGGSETTANTWATSIQTAFTTAGRTSTVTYNRRVDDGATKLLVISDAKLSVRIINF